MTDEKETVTLGGVGDEGSSRLFNLGSEKELCRRG